MELRCLVSSRGSAENFDLRCLVREKMVEYLQANYPSALPTLRVEMRSLAGEAAQLGKIAALDDQPVS
jgi:ABC-type thiamine transport system ATPase subunit